MLSRTVPHVIMTVRGGSPPGSAVRWRTVPRLRPPNSNSCWIQFAQALGVCRLQPATACKSVVQGRSSGQGRVESQRLVHVDREAWNHDLEGRVASQQTTASDCSGGQSCSQTGLVYNDSGSGPTN